MKIDGLVVDEKYSFWFGFPVILILDVRYVLSRNTKMGYYLEIQTNTLPVVVIANAFKLLLLRRYLLPFASPNRYICILDI